ncbi:MAG: glycosyltransferase [Pseudobutyrivibrio sp.]|nr:glycosyltransferase [Pseudobutyrivibrio sp.]
MLLSLCMPTNGITEWVLPALDSVYDSGVDCSLFEVIVTDNGDNAEFKKLMHDYASKHSNLIYKETDAYMFDNQLEALKLASGDYLKFMNHRAIWLPERLQYMIDFLEEYKDDEAVIYFSNGVLGWGPNYNEYDNFNDFVANLGVYGTWTTGVGIWKSQYEKVRENLTYGTISPHAEILYAERKAKKYVINDKYWMKEVSDDATKKGKYDLYKAFSLDELIFTINLYRDGDITAETLKKVKDSFRSFIIRCYQSYNLEKCPCSYDLDGFDKYVGIFFDKDEIKREAALNLEKISD